MKLKAILVCSLLALTFACKDQEPLDIYYDASHIEGYWQGTEPPYWYHWFSDGHSQQDIWDFGQNIYRLEYSFRTNKDSIFQTTLDTPKETRTWTVEFPHIDTCLVTEWNIFGDTVTTFTLVRL